MRFTSPLFLLLLALLPLFAWMGWPAPGSSRRREMLALILRLLIVLSLVLGLAGMEVVRPGSDLAVVFLVDVSDSMPAQAVDSEIAYVQEAIQGMGPDDQSAVVLFGADALVERPMSVAHELAQISSAPVTNQTDLAEAIRMGLALFPANTARRLVILSDGAQTSGDALSAAEFAKASGVQIVVVPFLSQPTDETLITQVDVPTRLRPGQNFNLNLSIEAANPMRSVIRVLSGSEVIYEQTQDLRRGTQTFSLPLTAGGPGFVSYQVQIAPEKDGFYQNNRLDAYSQVEGPPRILVVAPAEGETLPGGESRPDEFSALVNALQAAGFTVDLVTPNGLPSNLPGLAQYNAVTLVDVPARTLTTRQMESLRTYVHDLGGGLVAVGGPTSYGVGGYFGTPLEDALPVEMQIKDEQRRPSLGIVFIIDHSGSMADASGGVMKLELAKEAAARSVELLFPTDRVGVIAFDDTASWVVPMTDLANPDEVISLIGSIQPGGGTDIMSGMQAMADVLPDDAAKVKHVILLTDGGADPTGIPQLVQRLLAESGITLSTVGVGNDAASFLDDLAAQGGGRYHFTNDAASIPSIFTEETMLATHAYIEEGAFFPEQVNASPMLAGINSVPQLLGYVATSPKDLAQVILQSEKKDPILATWQYGLGRAVAFTSDASGRWARDWVGWQGFPTFWAQTVASTLSDTASTALELTVTQQGEQARLSVDAHSRTGDFLNGYEVNANLVAPNGEVQSVTLRQVAPGRYEAPFTPTEQGVYLIRLTGQAQDGQSFSSTAGWTLSYSPEYRNIESNPDLLLRLANLTGGTVASADPAEAFTHDLSASRASRPIWPWLLTLAALLFPFDIAARRLILTRQDWVKFMARLGFRRRVKVQQEERSERMDALLQAKRRVQQEPPAPIAPPVISEPKIEKVETPKKAPPAEPSSASTTASLLARKKAMRKKDE
jgi:Mg-chelatase subunit ChlD